MAQPITSVERLLFPFDTEEAASPSPMLQDLVAVAAQELRAMQKQQQQTTTSTTMRFPASPINNKTNNNNNKHGCVTREKLQHQYRCEMEDVRASLYFVEGALRDICAQNRRRWGAQVGVVRRIVNITSEMGEIHALNGGGGGGSNMGFASENGGGGAKNAPTMASGYQHNNNSHTGYGNHYYAVNYDNGHDGRAGSFTDMGSMTSRGSFSSTASDPSTLCSERDGSSSIAGGGRTVVVYPISPLEASQDDETFVGAAAEIVEHGTHDDERGQEKKKKEMRKRKMLRSVKSETAPLSPPPRHHTNTRTKKRSSCNRPTPVKKGQKAGGGITATRSKTRATGIAAAPATQQQVSPSPESDDGTIATSCNDNSVENADPNINEQPSDDGSGDETEETEASMTDDDMDLEDDEHTSANNNKTASTATAAGTANSRNKTKKQGQQQQQQQQTTTTTPRYNVPRHKGPRFASGPPGRPFRFQAKPRTVAGIWREFKVGTGGNPALEALEREHGTGWRRGDLRARKYASNYVGGRRGVVEYVERLARESGWGVDEAIRRLDERVDGRISALTDALRRGEDPFAVLSKRSGGGKKAAEAVEMVQ
ncbi:hypothetical protein JDV02_008716 [Purpureocillium takamizusanense]|uniref:Transcription activator GCR1-like domain-containing protein n=1 Tax=Purpureocillium takamizusanense TaxID=2060973 RepID=A0A9Q8QNB3_9HYPO|nr:uncharacterized protein JDV02_008716 [Purpureocillium takamizusanense]UNI22870.1 hypothetical protein JDV02_008716 [Purpureocillium takamizusanense]